VTSYGGKLTYTVMFDVPRDTAAEGVVKVDVRLEVGIFSLYVVIRLIM